MRISKIHMNLIAAAFMWAVAKLTPGKQTLKGDKPKPKKREKR